MDLAFVVANKKKERQREERALHDRKTELQKALAGGKTEKLSKELAIVNVAIDANEKELATVTAQDERMSLFETYDLAVKFRCDVTERIKELHARHGASKGPDGPPFSAAEREEIKNLTDHAERFGAAVLEFEGAMEKLRKVGADFSSILQTGPGPLMNPPVKFKDIDFEDDDCRNNYGLEQEHIVTNPEKYSPEEVAAAKVNLAEFIEITGGHPQPPFLRPGFFGP